MSSAMMPVALALWLAFTGGIARAQALTEPSEGSVRQKEFERVLNQLLPSHRDSKPKRFHVVLRFLPSFHPEEHIALSYGIDSRSEVEYVVFKKSLRTTLREDKEKGLRRSAHELGTLTGLQINCFSVSPQQMRGWLHALLASLASSGAPLERRALRLDGTPEEIVQLDGTEYHLDLEMGEDHVLLSLPGSEIGYDPSPDDVPIIRWMNSTRRQIMEMAKRR